MKNFKIFVLIFAIFIVIFGLTTRKSNMPAASRGKVIADTKSSLFDLNLNQASVLNFQQASDSVRIEGSVCELDQHDRPTGKRIKMKTRNFPKWFIANCDTGNFVDYIVVARGTPNERAQVTRIYR